MTAITQPLTLPGSHLRPFDVSKDLNAVADLVEACFADTLDADGHRYVQQMHAAARNPRYLRWATAVADHVAMPLTGYVWEENSFVAGNLSLIPFTSQGKRFYLIANVAVDPNYRRRGIARLLTTTAMQHAQNRGASGVWLHVREENLAAHNLYLSLGFTERTRRTSWECNLSSKGMLAPHQNTLPAGVTITPRRPQHWPQQRAWLERLYSPELTWHLPYSLSGLRPGPIGIAYRFLTDTRVQQWAALLDRELLGVLAWQPHLHHTDHLWLASTIEKEDLAISALLPLARWKLAERSRLTLDYPAGRGRPAFQEAGFRIQQTLIWMEVRCKG